MKKLHLYRFFDLVNARVFNDILPKTKLAISYKHRDYFGLCEVYGFRNRLPDKFKITLNYDAMMRFDRFNEEHIKQVLIHEMVHLWVGVKSGRDFYKVINIVCEHDMDIFNSIGEIAVDCGLLQNKDLLT